MTKAMLMNYGDGLRIVYAVSGEAVDIDVGKSREVDLADATHKQIKAAQGRDTLLLVSITDDTPKELTSVLAVLQSMHTTSYEELLVAATEVIGIDNMPGLRPTHVQIRTMLRDIAIEFTKGAKTIEAALAAIAAAEKERKWLKDDVDARELEREAEHLRPAPPPEAPKKTQREKMDEALGIATGNPVEEEPEAQALAPETKAEQREVKKAADTKSTFKPRKTATKAPAKKAGAAVRRVKAG